MNDAIWICDGLIHLFDSFDSNCCKVFFRLPDVTAASLIKMKGHNIYQFIFHIRIRIPNSLHVLRLTTDFLYVHKLDKSQSQSKATLTHTFTCTTNSSTKQQSTTLKVKWTNIKHRFLTSGHKR